MKRIVCDERPHWRSLAEQLGFVFHTIDGEPYWDESAYYQFSLAQIEQDIEAPTEELHQMCLSLVDDIVNDEQALRQLHIPEFFWPSIASSWQGGQPQLYGRMDFSYHGQGPAKLLELNYDTPTSLYECGFFQWVWLEDAIKQGLIPGHADQFNSLQDKLLSALQHLAQGLSLRYPQDRLLLHTASIKGSPEDRGTVQYLQDIAEQAGLRTQYLHIEDIGLNKQGQFTDLNEQEIQAIFKLYPWEDMLLDPFAQALTQSDTLWFEPPWKALLSNKGILPLLWQRYPNHPNLLPSYFVESGESHRPLPGWVSKPLFSREGANVHLRTPDGYEERADGPYEHMPFIRQAFHALPKFGEHYTLIGSWVIGDSAAGIGIREDDSLITKDSSRFLPHIILD